MGGCVTHPAVTADGKNECIPLASPGRDGRAPSLQGSPEAKTPAALPQEEEEEEEDNDDLEVLRPDRAQLDAVNAAAAAMLSSIPWKEQPDLPTWLNKALDRFWPHLSAALVLKIRDKADSEIRNHLPDWIEGHVKIDRLSFGTIGPRILRVHVDDTFPEAAGLRIAVDVEVEGGIDVSASIGPFSFGIDKLKASGEIVLEMGPMVGELPVATEIKLYFLDSPDIDFTFSGLAKAAEFPPMRYAVRAAIHNALASRLVMPNGLTRELVQRNDVMVNEQARPKAVLRVRVVKAQGLQGSDWSLFSKSTSDAYVQVTVGSKMWNTSVVKNTCDPEFPDSDVHDFLVYDLAQVVKCRVLDDDWLNDDDLLGCTEPLQVKDIVAQSDKPMELYSNAKFYRRGSTVLGEGGRGKLTMQFTLLRLDPKPTLTGISAAAASAEGFLLAVDIRNLVMPARLADIIEVGVRTERYSSFTTRVETPQGTLKAAVQAVDKTVRHIVRQGRREGIPLETLARITGLEDCMVHEILKIGSKCPRTGQPCNLGGERVVAEVPFNTTVFVPVSKRELESGHVTLLIRNTNLEVLAKETLKLAELGTSWPMGPKSNFIVLKDGKQGMFTFHGKASVVQLHE